MARDLGPKCKQCRREGVKLFLKGERCLTEKCAIERRSYPPGDHGRGRIKQSEYLLQLREKQRARFTYGLMEGQLRRYYKQAVRRAGVTGETLVRLLEQRLDNVVFRLGFADSRSQARQVVSAADPPRSPRRAAGYPNHADQPGWDWQQAETQVRRPRSSTWTALPDTPFLA